MKNSNYNPDKVYLEINTTQKSQLNKPVIIKNILLQMLVLNLYTKYFHSTG